MNDSERTETKWPGVDRLADRMWHSSLPEIQDELRRALEPLLENYERLEELGAFQLSPSANEQDEFLKELDVWRKR